MLCRRIFRLRRPSAHAGVTGCLGPPAVVTAVVTAAEEAASVGVGAAEPSPLYENDSTTGTSAPSVVVSVATRQPSSPAASAVAPSAAGLPAQPGMNWLISTEAVASESSESAFASWSITSTSSGPGLLKSTRSSTTWFHSGEFRFSATSSVLPDASPRLSLQ